MEETNARGNFIWDAIDKDLAFTAASMWRKR